MRQRNELGVYLINLSVADLLYIATLPLWIDYFLHHDNWIHGQESCKLFGFIFYTNIYVSIAFLCCISLDRYLAVAYPLRFAKVRRIKTGESNQAAVVELLLQQEVHGDGTVCLSVEHPALKLGINNIVNI